MILKPRTFILGLLLCVLSLTNLSAQALVGAWYVGDTSATDSDVVVFFGNGYYMHMSDDFNGGGYTGYERGTYSWSEVNDTSFTATAIVDNNDDNGLSHFDVVTTTFSITGDSLTITDAGGLASGAEVLTRVSGANAIVGAWFEGDITANDGSNVLVFMSNLTYFLASDQGTDGAGHPGIERGTYTWNPVSGAFTSSTALDTDGDFGLSDPPYLTNITVSGGIMTVTDSDGSGSLYSVTAVPEPSTYAVIAGALCLGIAMLRRRRD